MSSLEKVISSCHYLLHNYPEAREARDYLDSRLGNSVREIFQFGYFPNSLHIQVLIDLVGEEQLLKTELFRERYIEDALFPRKIRWCYFEHHPLLFAFRDPYGNTQGLIGRTLLPESQWKELHIPKYKNTVFKKGNFLFGLYENKQAIMEQNCVYVVEGQFDAMKAMEIGLRNVVAIGNNNMSFYQFSVINRYTNNIFMLLDNDSAGKKGRERAISKFGHLANIRNFYIPNGYKDIDEYITKEEIGKYEDLSLIVKA